MKRLILAFALFVVLPRSAFAQAETIEYYGQDAIGSIRIVFAPDGTVLGRQDYAPFGRPLFPVPAMPKEGFGAQEKDDETDQANFHARMMQARTGRFTRPDPIQDGQLNPQAWNRHAYALNQPVSVVDPTGLRARGDEWNGSECNADAGNAAENAGDCFPWLWDWQWGGVPGNGGPGGTGGGIPAPGTPAPAPGPPPVSDPPDGDPPGCEALGLAAAGCGTPPEPGPGPKTGTERCRVEVTRQSYGAMGPLMADTIVPEFSPISIATNSWAYLKGSAGALGAKGLVWPFPIRSVSTTKRSRVIFRPKATPG